MPFLEVTPERLQQKSEETMRFFMDPLHQINLHLWLDKEGAPQRFQIASHHEMLEWTPQSGCRTGRVDDGESKSFGVKSSPLMQMTGRGDQKVINTLRRRLQASLSEPQTPQVEQAIQFIVATLGQEETP